LGSVQFDVIRERDNWTCFTLGSPDIIAVVNGQFGGELILAVQFVSCTVEAEQRVPDTGPHVPVIVSYEHI
jgi:hypothetical protein